MPNAVALVWRFSDPRVLAPGRSQLRKDATEESEYAGFPWGRFLQPLAFVPRWVDLKKSWKSPDAGFVVACHSLILTLASVLVEALRDPFEHIALP